jgi:hypothetical protein
MRPGAVFPFDIAAGADPHPDPSRIARIVRVDLIRRYRAVRATPRQFAALVVAVAIGGVPTLGAAAGTYFFGVAVARGDVGSPAAVAGPAAGAVVAGLAVLVALRTAQQGATPAHPDGLLTTVRHTEAALAVLGSELVVSGGVAAIPALVAAVAFGTGTGSAVVAWTAVVAALGAIVVAVPFGVVLGLIVRNAVARSPTLARYRVAAGAVVLLAYLGVVLSQSEADTVLPVVGALAATPAGWFGHLAVVSLGGRPELAAGALGLVGGGGAVLVLAVIRLTAALWYVDPVRPARQDGPLDRLRSLRSGDGDALGLGTVPGLGPPMAGVVRKSWRRAVRNPLRLVYVAYPLLLLYAPVARSLRTGEISETLAPLIALYGAWAVGAAFTLNPLGDEGNVLPVTLTTPIDGRRFVGALCLAALSVGLPLVTAATLAAAVAGPLSLGAAGVIAFAGAVTTTAGTGIAAGVGTLFPRLEAVRVTRSREAVVPSLVAFVAYSTVLGLVGLPATLVGLPGLPAAVAAVAGVPLDVVLVGGLGTTALLGAAAGLVGFAYAARTFDRFSY